MDPAAAIHSRALQPPRRPNHGLDAKGRRSTPSPAHPDLAKFVAHNTLLVRGESLAAGMSDYLITQIEATPTIDVRLRSRVLDGRGDARLEALTVEDAGTGRREKVAAAASSS